MDAEEFARKIIEIIDGMGDNDLETISVIEKYCQKLILEKRLPEPEFTKTKKAETTSKVTSKVTYKVSNDLEEAAQEYTEKGSKCQEELDAFIAGAKWQKERIMANSTNATIGLPYENKYGGYTHLIDVSRPLSVGNNTIAIIFKED